MPVKDGIGYGEYTGVKIEHLSKILAMHMAITQAVIKGTSSYFEPEYRYVDLTAEKGIHLMVILVALLCFLIY